MSLEVSDSLSNSILNRFMLLHSIDQYSLNLEKGYEAWVVGWNNGYGVAIPYDGDEINEDFNNVTLSTIYPSIHGMEQRRYLALMTSPQNARNHFATICENFVDPGKDGTERRALLRDPRGWWDSWRELIGNSSSERAVYSVLGELVVLLYLKRQGLNVKWAGPNAATHDITSTDIDYEVKSSLSRYFYRVHIAGEHQLKVPEGKELQMFFCRMEESLIGISLEDVVGALEQEGMSRDELMSNLNKLGIKKGSHLMSMRYSVLEMVSFLVDDEFPMITNKSFKGDVNPTGISHISYDASLDHLDMTNHDIPVL